MKKFLLFILALILIPTLFACDDRETVRILAPGEYISEDVVRAFRKEHNVKVRIDEFASNEEAITFIKSNKVYDLIMPSDYALEQLILENKNDLVKIDWSKITTFDKENDMAEGLTELLTITKEENLDYLEYGVPYFWGSVGILYNSDVVSEDDLTGWDILQKGDKYNVAFYDSSRDALMAGLVSLGYSMNSNVESEILEAKAWVEVATKKGVGYVTDDIFDYIPDKTYDLAMAYTGDATEIMHRMIIEEENINLGYFIPEQGSNVWVDFWSIHARGNQELAYLFINFISSYEWALENTYEIMYISPREDVRLQQIKNAKSSQIAQLYSIEFRENDDIFRYDPVSKRLIDEAWNSIGTSR